MHVGRLRSKLRAAGQQIETVVGLGYRFVDEQPATGVRSSARSPTMADKAQTYQNHARFFPLFHFFVMPVLLLNFVNQARYLYRVPSEGTVFAVVVALALVMLGLSARIMANTVQDRVIRLEMRLRLHEILPADLQARVNDLTRAAARRTPLRGRRRNGGTRARSAGRKPDVPESDQGKGQELAGRLPALLADIAEDFRRQEPAQLATRRRRQRVDVDPADGALLELESRCRADQRPVSSPMPGSWPTSRDAARVSRVSRGRRARR